MSEILETYQDTLRTDYLIGCFHKEDGKCFFEDLRGATGERVKRWADDSPIERTEPFTPDSPLKEGEYYQFAWTVKGTMDSYQFICEGSICPLDKENLLENRLKENLNLSEAKRQESLQFQEMINREVTGKSHTYVYELLQNANDYPQRDPNGKKQSVKVKFIVTDKYLYFVHSGDVFRLPNIVAITTVNEGEKKANTDTIGYKGMGFKSVFVKNDMAYLESGEWSLRFDEKEIDRRKRFKYPWQYMPIYTRPNEVETEVRRTLDALDDSFLVKFALRHRSDAKLHLPNLKRVFEDKRILVFIPYVNDVEVYDHNERLYHVTKDNDEWLIHDTESIVVDEHYRDILKKSEQAENKIPEKFNKIDKIRFAFAVKREGNKLIPLPDAIIYNYLPTSQSIEMPFLLNADFVPKADRDSLADIEWNFEVMTELGRRYARWWASLLDESKGFEISSVFDLLPDFQKGIAFRECFMKGFEEEICRIPCIPVLADDTRKVIPLNEIILDNHEFIVAEKPVMSDEDFYMLTGYDEYSEALPHPEIRRHPKLKALLNHFSSKLGRVLNKEDILFIPNSQHFAEWMKREENAIAYYDFLFRKSWMISQLKRTDRIFLTEHDEIAAPGSLFFDIDYYLRDLEKFEDLLPRLKRSVRDKLLQGFRSIEGKFKIFSPVSKAIEIGASFDILGYASRIESMEDSIHLLSFLSYAKEGQSTYTGTIPRTMPIYLQDGSIYAGSADLYVEDELGDSLVQQDWIKPEWINFIHQNYVGDTTELDRFLERCGVKAISGKTIWDKFVSDKERIPEILQATEDYDINIEFYKFLADIDRDVTFTTELKTKYKVFCEENDEVYSIPLSETIFFYSDELFDFKKKSWIVKGSCHELDHGYFEGLDEEDEESMQDFLKNQKIAIDFTEKSWFRNCLKESWKEIIDNISSKEQSYDLLEFLYNNKDLVDSFGISKLGSIPLAMKEEPEMICLDDVDSNETVYQCSDALDELSSEPWFPSYQLTVLDDSYQRLFDSIDRKQFFEKVGLKEFGLVAYLNATLFEDLDSYIDLDEAEDPVAASIAFHHFFAKRQSDLDDNDCNVLKKAPLYIMLPEGSKEESGFTREDSSTGYFIPSVKIEQLVEADIVPVDILKTIHPSYFTSDKEMMESYFINKLGNKTLEDKDIVKHISDNKDEILPYLSNFDRNIGFWKWAAESATNFEDRKVFRSFPMMDSELNLLQPKDLYTTALYSEDKTAESIIRRFVPDAHFVSEEYILESPDTDWIKLFKSLSIRISAEYILMNDVLKKLGTFKTADSDVVLALAGIVDSLKKEYSANQEQIGKNLSYLFVKCNDGLYRKIGDTIISGEYMGVESGKYSCISLPAQVSEDYLKGLEDNPTLRSNIIRFFQFLGEIIGAKVVKTAADLNCEKVAYFAANQQLFKDRERHYAIIGELAEDSQAQVPWMAQALKDKALYLYSSDGRFVDMSKCKMYLGSIYNPSCDYQANGFGRSDDFVFVSDEYRNHATLSAIKSFLIKQKVRWGFHGETELKYLENPTFSVYFWGTFLPAQLNNTESQRHFDGLLTVERLEKLSCIPTGSGMKRPSAVYDPSDQTLVRMIKALQKQDEYLPTVKMPIMYLAGFAAKLSPNDCLEYLALEDKGRSDDRLTVCEWLANIPENILKSNFKNYINQFRETVKWKNGAKKWVPLKDLYVLDRSKESKLIVDHFGGSERVCFTSSMPESNAVQQKLCAVLGLTVISHDDFDYKPVGNCYEDGEEENEIAKRLLYLSYKENKDGDWETKYKKRKEIQSKTKIQCCDGILYFYEDDESLSTTLYFLNEKEKGFSYKKGYKDRMSESKLDWVRETFDLGDVHATVLQGLFFENFEDYIRNHDGGSLPECVRQYLSEADRDNISVDLEEELPEESEELYVSVAKVPYQPGTNASKEISSKKNEPESEENVQRLSEKGQKELQTSPKTETPTQHSPSSEQKPKEEQTIQCDERKPSEPSKSEKPKEAKEPKQTSNPQKPEKSFEERSQERWAERRDSKVTPPSSQAPLHHEDEEIVDIEENLNDTPQYGEVYNPASNGKRLHETPPRPQSKGERNYDRNVDNAREKTREEEEKRDRRVKLNEIEKYTLQWFNYLIDMQLEAVKESHGGTRTLDLYDWQLIDKAESIYRLVSPSSFIPSNLAESAGVKIMLVSNGKKQTLLGEILESDESGLDFRCKTYFGSPSPTRWIRIVYQNTSGFSHDQAKRFSQLNHKYSLATRLDQQLPSAIEFIYGPPGTGKTTELVKIISESIRTHARYNILVVTPTNRAADEIAERLVGDTFAGEHLTRFGITESRDLIHNHSYVLKNRNSLNINDDHKNVVVTTIARYPYDCVQPYGEPIFNIDWDLIIVDEASMIDIVPITLLLVNNKAPKFIIAGDPKQIRPVKPSFDYPDEHVYNIYDMVDLNSFRMAKEGKTRYPVKVLDVQHRSIQAIGNLVSSFSYDNVLRNDPDKAAPKALTIPGMKVDAINVVGYEVVTISHLYDFHKVDNSHVHVYSAIFAYEFAAHIARLVMEAKGNESYTIGIVSPYKKQASAIQEMLASKSIDNERCTVKCGTVHKFQGSECDIMIVVMNYPDTKSGPNANINNLNIMNVAMSRAKDYVFFLSPERRKDERDDYPMNDELFSHLPEGFNFVHAHKIEQIMFGDEVFIAKNASLRSHLPVNVSTPTDKRYEVRISDTALDILINEKS